MDAQKVIDALLTAAKYMQERITALEDELTQTQISETALKEQVKVAKELQARDGLDKLPKTADGQPIVPGCPVWFRGRPYPVEAVSGSGARLRPRGWVYAYNVYSSLHAFEAAGRPEDTEKDDD